MTKAPPDWEGLVLYLRAIIQALVSHALQPVAKAEPPRGYVPALLRGWRPDLGLLLAYAALVHAYIRGKRFDIVCDDEGLFKEDCRISALDRDWQPMLCGSLFVCKSHEGELVGLTEAEVSHVLRHVHKIPTRRYPDGVLALTMVEY